MVEQVPAKGKSILLVEDDPDVRDAVVALLEAAGYRVVAAEHGREALARLRTDASAFCMILLDLFMPEMNGWTFRTEQMRDPALAGIPVLVLSADSHAAQRAITPGVVGAMTKPIEFDRLLEVIAKHC
jgi:CheY-like chemotaxis protein